MKFTETSTKALKPKPDRYEVAEGNGHGFRVRIYPSGNKSFIGRYRFGAHSRVTVYGRFPGKSLAEALTRLDDGIAELYQLTPAAG